MLKVMIVDDQDLMRDFVVMAIRKYFECAHIVQAESGKDAIVKLQEMANDVDWVICDYSMPNGTGNIVCDYAKQAGLQFVIYSSTDPNDMTGIDPTTTTIFPKEGVREMMAYIKTKKAA